MENNNVSMIYLVEYEGEYSPCDKEDSDIIWGDDLNPIIKNHKATSFKQDVERMNHGDY